MHAILTLEDVLDGLLVEVEGFLVDAVVKVVVIQHGSKEFEIQELDVESDIKVTDKDTNAFLGYVKFNDHDDSFKTKFNTLVEIMALEKARNAPEDLWDYKQVD